MRQFNIGTSLSFQLKRKVELQMIKHMNPSLYERNRMSMRYYVGLEVLPILHALEERYE